MAGANGIEYGGERDPATPRYEVATENSERDGTPDSETTLPDLQRVQRVPTWAEVELVIGDHVIEPGADNAERHANDDHQLHAVRGAAPGLPALCRDDHCDDDACDDAQRVRPEREGADVPDVRGGAGG
jgi:hypothetical protein